MTLRIPGQGGGPGAPRPPRLGGLVPPPLRSAHRLPLRGPAPPSARRPRLPCADAASWRPPGAPGWRRARSTGGTLGWASTAGQEPAALTVGREAGARGRDSCGRRTRRRLRGGSGGATARSRQRRRLSARGPAPGLQGPGAGLGLLAPPRRSGPASAPPPPLSRPSPPAPAPAPLGAQGEDPRAPSARPTAPKGRGLGAANQPTDGYEPEQTRSASRPPLGDARAEESPKPTRIRPGPQRRLFWKGCVVIALPASSVPTTSLERAWAWGLSLRSPNRSSSQRGQPAPRGVCMCAAGVNSERPQQSWSPKGRPTPRPTSGHLPGYPVGLNSSRAVPSPSLAPLHRSMVTWGARKNGLLGPLGPADSQSSCWASPYEAPPTPAENPGCCSDAWAPWIPFKPLVDPAGLSEHLVLGGSDCGLEKFSPQRTSSLVEGL